MYLGKSGITTTSGRIGQCIIDKGDGTSSFSAVAAGVSMGMSVAVVALYLVVNWFLDKLFFFMTADLRVGDATAGVLEVVALVVVALVVVSNGVAVVVVEVVAAAVDDLVSVACEDDMSGKKDGDEEENPFEASLPIAEGRTVSFLVRPVIKNSCERGDFKVCCCCRVCGG
jgi:hypothetical protein